VVFFGFTTVDFSGNYAVIAIFMQGNESLYTSLLESLFSPPPAASYDVFCLVDEHDFRGIVATPKIPWEICAIADIITISPNASKRHFQFLSQMRTFTYGMATLIGIRVWKTKGCSLTSATSSESSYRFYINFEARSHIETFRPVRSKMVD
jgi:hypothetical protein